MTDTCIVSVRERVPTSKIASASTGNQVPAINVAIEAIETPNISDTIDSLLNQDYQNYEIIAVNDASTDNTGEILDEIAAEHPAVRVIHFDKNQGKAMALRMIFCRSSPAQVLGPSPR